MLYEVITNILGSGYKGRLYAINPKHETIQGQPAYKSIEEIGARVEMAVIATRPQTVPQIIEQCGRSGVRNVIVIASGFSEAGHIGAALERKAMEIARSYNVRVLGPNCLGIIRPELGLNATFTKISAVITSYSIHYTKLYEDLLPAGDFALHTVTPGPQEPGDMQQLTRAVKIGLKRREPHGRPAHPEPGQQEVNQPRNNFV